MIKKRILKVSIYVFVTILALILALPFLFKSYIKNHLVENYNASQSEYRLSVGDLNITGFNSGFMLSDVELINSDSCSQSPLCSLKAKSIDINGVSIFKLIFNKCLVAKKLEIVSPFIVMNRVEENKEKEVKKEEGKNAIDIDEIEIADPHFAYFMNRTDTLPLFKTDKGMISIREFSIDTLPNKKDFSAYDISARLHGIKYLSQDSLYTIQISTLQVSYSDRSLRVDSFRVIPNYSKKIFGKKAGNQVDMMDLSIPLIESKSFDVKSFVEYQVIRADSMEIKSFLLKDFRDKNVFSKVEYPTTVQQKLYDFQLPLSIKHLKVVKGDVFYEELRKGSVRPGNISFENIRADIENITNIHPEDTFRISAKTMFCRQSAMEVVMEFPMAKDDNSLICSGKLGSFPAKTLNGLLPVIAGVSIESGYINSLDFNYHATMKKSTGFVDFKYKDLKVAVVNPDDGKTQNAGNKIVSLIANTFVVRKDSPSKNNTNSKGKIDYKRDPERFIFNYSWNSIFDGVKRVVTGKEK